MSKADKRSKLYWICEMEDAVDSGDFPDSGLSRPWQAIINGRVLYMGQGVNAVDVVVGWSRDYNGRNEQSTV